MTKLAINCGNWNICTSACTEIAHVSPVAHLGIGKQFIFQMHASNFDYRNHKFNLITLF